MKVIAFNFIDRYLHTVLLAHGVVIVIERSIIVTEIHIKYLIWCK